MKLTVSKVLNVALLSLITLLMFVNATTSTSEDGYDPWVDYDENGVIDHIDLYLFARSYGETGAPAKIVNVTNWPTQQPEPVYKVIALWDKKPISWTKYGGVQTVATEILRVGGYSTIFVYLQVTNISSTQYGATEVYVGSLGWYPYLSTEPTSDEPFQEIAGNPGHKLALEDTSWGCAEYEVKGPTVYFEINVDPHYSGDALISLYIYLRN